MNILKCTKCGKYSLVQCKCGGKSISPKPAKYSPEDKYAKYRRQANENINAQKSKQQKSNTN